VKRGEVATADVHVDAGLRPERLSAKPADAAPEVAAPVARP
jgi:hypothetical protein